MLFKYSHSQLGNNSRVDPKIKKSVHSDMRLNIDDDLAGLISMADFGRPRSTTDMIDDTYVIAISIINL